LALQSIMSAPPLKGPITLFRDRSPVTELDLGPSPHPGLPGCLIAFLKEQLGRDQPLPALIQKRGGSWAVHVRLIPDAPGYGPASRLLSHAGVLSVPFQGATRLIPFAGAPAVLPACCVRLLMRNVPGQMGSSALARAVLELAGYTVEEPGDAAGPLAPRPGIVTLCQIKPATLPGGQGFHTGTIIAEIIPPIGDPLLRDLPPAMRVEELGRHWVQTLIEGDTLPRAPRPDTSPPALAVVAHAGGSGHGMTAPGPAAAGYAPPPAAPLPPPASGALPQEVTAAVLSGSPSQGQPPGQRLGSEAGGSGGVAPTPRILGVHDAPSHAPGGSAAPTPGGSPSSPTLVPSGSFGQGTGVEAGGTRGGAPPPRAPGEQELALLAPGGPAAMPSGSSTLAALPPSNSTPAPCGTAPPPPPPHDGGPATCPICQDPLLGPAGFATSPCGHQFCMPCFVTNAAINSRDNIFPCPLCRFSIGSPVQEAMAMLNMPERAAWDREQELLELERIRSAFLEEEPAPPPPLLLPPASSPLPPPEPLSSPSPPEPSDSLEPILAPRASSQPLAPPQLQPAPAISLDLGETLRPATSAASGPPGAWRRSQRLPVSPPPRWQREEPAWRTNYAARRSNDGSHSSSLEPSRSRSRSISPPSRPPSPPTSALPPPSSSHSLRPRAIPRSAWGSGIRRQMAWDSGLPHQSPPQPTPHEGGRGRW